MRRRPKDILALAAVVLWALSGALPLAADTVTSSATSSVVLDELAPARHIDEPDPLLVVNVLEDGLEGSCRLHARQGARDRKGVRVRFTARLIDANTLEEITSFASFGRRTDKNGELSVGYAIPAQGNFAQQVALVAEVEVASRKKVTEVHFSCELVDAAAAEDGPRPQPLAGS